MAKYGYFRMPGPQPSHEYEGDYMTQDKQFVQIWKRSRNDNEVDHQVAAIHLDKGEFVKQITD